MASKRLIASLALLTIGTACRETTLVPPRSLDGPTSIAVSRGDVCLTTFETESRTVDFVIEPCANDVTGAIGLVINERSDRLALLDLSLAVPRLVDLDPTTPGPNHLEVGRLPVDVAVSPDQTAAYTLNQLDRDVSIIDLRIPAVLPERYHLDETPIAMQVEPVSGEVVVAAGSPSQLFVFPGATTCADDAAAGEFRCDVAASDDQARSLELPGTVSDFVFAPAGDEAWVVYRDLNYASVVSFAPTPDGFDSPCLNGVDTKPCVIAQVPLTYGCSDGLDNDGDGLVDQQDAQCWGPLSAESPTGIGRRFTDACANGIDDDGDGLTDRDDPECMAASGVSEEVGTFSELPLAACNDGVDGDGDGRTDYPADSACYGDLGRTEQTIPSVGFDGIGIDTHGVFVYVIDRSGEQVLIADATRKRLIDTPSAQIPATNAFDSELGVDVIPSPLAVTGAIERSIVWQDPDDAKHAVVRHEFGAWVSSNDGSLQYVDAVVSFCEVNGEELVEFDEFAKRNQGPVESRCLQIPELPLAGAVQRVVAGDETLVEACKTAEFAECAICLAGDGESCEACDMFAETQFDLCDRAFAYEDVTAYFNPRFSLRDVVADSARVLGVGSCEQPDALAEQLSEFATANPTAPQDLKCTSLLQEQPLVPSAANIAPDDIAALEDLERAEVFRLRTLQFDITNDLEPLVGLSPYDSLALAETIVVTYEGVLPGTDRSDAVLATETEEDGSLWIDVGINNCSAGVKVGDRFVVTDEPVSGCDVEGTFEFEIVEVKAGDLRIAPLDIEGAADAVPTRSCFDTAVSYEIRPSDEWVVAGTVLGYLTDQVDLFGECVPRYEADRIESRVSSGELFSGPYYSFFMYPGFAGDEIADFRDTSFSFQFATGFLPLQHPTCSSLSQQCGAGLFPTDVIWVPGLPNGTLLLSPDPNDNFVHVRNVDDAAAAYTVIR